MTGLRCTVDRDHATVAVRVTTRSNRTEVLGVEDGVIQIRVAQPPVDGKANAAVVTCLARTLGVAPTRLVIVSGQASRDKRVQVAGRSCTDIVRALAAISGGSGDWQERRRRR